MLGRERPVFGYDIVRADGEICISRFSNNLVTCDYQAEADVLMMIIMRSRLNYTITSDMTPLNTRPTS